MDQALQEIGDQRADRGIELDGPRVGRGLPADLAEGEQRDEVLALGADLEEGVAADLDRVGAALDDEGAAGAEVDVDRSERAGVDAHDLPRQHRIEAGLPHW